MPAIALKGILDSTLREGGQAPGIYFKSGQQLAIIASLAALGVEEIEVGTASPHMKGLPELVSAAKEIAGPGSRVALWCRCLAKDIHFAAACDPDVLSLSIPVSDIQIRTKMRSSRSRVLEKMAKSVAMALDLGIPAVSIGLEDATRADMDFLLEAVVCAEARGAWRIRLADTVGISTPGEMSRLVEKVCIESSLSIGVHTHNDFGMATANAIAALEAGAGWIDATVLGLGERAGSCRLEEVVGYLKLYRGIGRYRPEILPGLSQQVAEAAKICIPGSHPVVGKDIFTCETGLHVHSLARDPRTYEPFDPERIGVRRSLLFGAKTGRGAIRSCLASHGFVVAEKDAEELASQLRCAKMERGRIDENGLVLLARRKGVIRESQAG